MRARGLDIRQLEVVKYQDGLVIGDDPSSGAFLNGLLV